MMVGSLIEYTNAYESTFVAIKRAESCLKG
mgnify:CR=1 FL=1